MINMTPRLILIAPEIYFLHDKFAKNEKINFADLCALVALFNSQSLTDILTLAFDEPYRKFLNFIEWSEKRGIDISIPTKLEVKNLHFPLGPPKEGILYALHPSSKAQYYPCANFHQFAFESKFSEAIRLLVSLGAKRIQIEHISGWSHEASAVLQSTFNIFNFSAQANQEKNQIRSIIFEAEYDGHNNPNIPVDATWIHSEPMWKLVAEGRIKNKMKKFSMNISYTDDYKINSDLVVEARALNISLGGTLKEHISTVWKIEGDFL